jgi:thiazole/oxazole-forming peptide maturase SagD family component
VDERASAAGPALVRELRAIIRQGPERSSVIDHVLAVDLENRDESLHRVIPLSRCAICGGAARFPQTPPATPRLSPDDSPEVVLDALAGWVDGRTGVISGVFLEPSGEMALGAPFIATAAPPHVMEAGSLRQLPIGWGKGLTVSGAVLSAVGEAIERYAASLPDPERIIWERPDDLGAEFLDPRTFALYTDAQYDSDDFPYARYDPGVRHPWVRGRWLGSDAPVWIPAVFAFLSLTLETEHVICQGSSNGLAASFGSDDGARRAALELVERDALMSAWFLGCPARRVELDDTLDPLLGGVIDGIEGLGAVVEVYVLPTSACGTTVLCLGLGDGERYPGVTIALGADLDARAALQQAVLELGQTGPHLRRMMQSSAVPVPPNAASVREMLDHAAYYFPLERAQAFDRLRGNVAPIALRDVAKQGPSSSLTACVSALDAAGVRVAVVDVTPPDVATGPFRVVRAVSPDLQPISHGYGLERQPVRRIRDRGLASNVPAIHPIW